MGPVCQMLTVIVTKGPLDIVLVVGGYHDIFLLGHV